MKKLMILLAILSTGILSCKKDKAPLLVESENFDLQNATLIAAGSLSFSLETNTGMAKVYRQNNGKFVLGLEKMNFQASASMFIYLSSTETVSSSSIKITSVRDLYGDLYYVLPAGIDFTVYKFLILRTELSEETVATARLS